MVGESRFICLYKAQFSCLDTVYLRLVLDIIYLTIEVLNLAHIYKVAPHFYFLLRCKFNLVISSPYPFHDDYPREFIFENAVVHFLK